MKYRKKPVVIEAMKFTYPPSGELLAWMGEAAGQIRMWRHLGAVAEMDVKTLEDGHDDRVRHVATNGDWIIRGVKGEFYPCKPDIFEQTYEAVS